MKKILILLLFVSSLWAQEYRRPTNGVNGGITTFGSCGVGATWQSPSSMPNSYDGGTATPPSGTKSNQVLTTIGDGEIPYTTYEFNTWAAASGSYTTLTLGVNFYCKSSSLVNVTGSCVAWYSLNNGSSWAALTTVSATTSTTPVTYTTTVAATTSLSNINIAVCAQANDQSGLGGTLTFALYDVWTAGTFGNSNAFLNFAIF